MLVSADRFLFDLTAPPSEPSLVESTSDSTSDGTPPPRLYEIFHATTRVSSTRAQENMRSGLRHRNAALTVASFDPAKDCLGLPSIDVGLVAERDPRWQALATVLAHAVGSHDGKRSNYSVAETHPIDVYLVTHSAMIGRGVYYYHPSRERIYQLRRDVNGVVAHDAEIMLVLAASLGRSYWLLGERAYRYALIEAGMVAERIDSRAAEIGVSVQHLPLAADSELERAIRVDGIREMVVHAVALTALK